MYPTKGGDNKVKPQILLTPGKVGNMSIHSYMQENGNKNVIAIHSLEPYMSQDGVDVMRYFGKKVVQERLCRKEALLKFVDENNSIDLVTLVRDPLTRNISSFFYNKNVYSGSFIQNMNHDWILNWFDNEFLKNFNIDIYNYPFDKESGWSAYSIGKFNILIMQCEKLNKIAQVALSSFSDVPYGTYNKNVNKNNNGDYLKFISTAKFDIGFLNKMYKSRYASHFYTDSFIDEKIEKWSI